VPEAYDKEEMRRLLLILFPLLLIGCRSKSYVSEVRITDSVRWETRDSVHVIEKRVIRDSVRIKDSIVVQIDSTGRVTDRWHTVYKYVTSDAQLEFYKAKIDSLESIKRRDSIVTETIYKEPTMFQEFKMRAFWFMSVIILSLVFFMIKRFS
jgi:hypothetical protein